MAARRARHHRAVSGCRSAGCQRAGLGRRCSWCPPSPASAVRTGTPTRAARWSVFRVARRAGTSHARRSRPSRSRAPKSCRPCSATRGMRWSSCAWTAARRATTCCCSSRPTCSACRWCAREVTETTALGAAYLAGLGVGFWSSPTEVTANWRAERRFEPVMSRDEAASRLARWARAVDRSRDWDVAS